MYLKTVGVIVLLAQAGSFVPATAARLGLVDRLFTRIVACEAAAVAGSSFSLDLGQVGRALCYATPRSLCLIDELGKGTAAVDGAALLAATVRGLQRIAPTPPITMVSTHFTEVCGLLESGCGGALEPLPPGLVKLYEMRVLLEGEPDAPTVTPLFRVVPGRCTQSYGLACATKAGLPAELVSRAASVRGVLLAGGLPAPLGRGAALLSTLLGKDDWAGAPAGDVDAAVGGVWAVVVGESTD